MRTCLRRVFPAVVLASLLLIPKLTGQTLGTMTGEITDSTGAAITDALVTVRNTATNGVRTASTNEAGVYTIPALVPGIYDVRAEKSGFKAARRNGI